MGLKAENFIEVAGVSEELPTRAKNFKEVHIQEISYLDVKKTDMQDLLRTFAKVEIINTKMMNTPKGISQDGQILTGMKLLVEGRIIQKIEYIANNISQPVYETHFYIPFSTYVILGKEFNYYSKVEVTPYIEDIYIRQISERKIFQSILLALDVSTLS
ncbi:DUF3794 domain-containing protein [Lutibacter sp. B2]|nr:DUF3794 domain-containing protein [Lutibacter sp. B2]